ncbi:MAG: TolB family protein [Vicinamibacterales bacterium]
MSTLRLGANARNEHPVDSRLTDDPPRDRAPMFTRDGQSIVFYSTRGGDWEAWTIRTDGSGLRRIAANPGGVVYSIPSPRDDSVLVNPAVDDAYFVRAWLNNPSKTPERLPYSGVGDAVVDGMDWSHDGSKIACIVISHGGHTAHVAVDDLSTQRLTIVNDDTAGGVRWLPDNRRLVYFGNNRSELVTFDTITRQRTAVDVQLPGPSVNDVFAIARDGRTIYYGAVVHTDADLWIAERK